MCGQFVLMPENRNNGISTASECNGQKTGPLPADFLRSVPNHPGIYLMKGAEGKILYVGKAKDLRKRLASYQRLDPAASPKTALLIGRVKNIETILTHTEKEAFILEASMIKKHRPRFNIELKDDKSYPRIKVTLGEEWPRVYVTRRRVKDGSRYFGPYASAGAMRNTLNLINRLFPLRRCKGRSIKKRQRPCLNYQMGRCLAPCSGLVDKKQYRKMVDAVLMILEGRNMQLRGQLETEMHKASADLEYEKAAMFRDQLQAMDKTLEKQVVVNNLCKDQDVFGYVRIGTGIALAVLHIRQGLLLGQQLFFILDPIGNDSEVLDEVLRQFYSREESIPDELLLPFQVPGHLALTDWLTEMQGRKVQVRIPKRGNGVKLLQMAAVNARQVHIDQENREKSWQEMAKNLQLRLHLTNIPERIECLDISNIGGKQPVGSLVCFIRGEKEKQEYRHYSISGLHEPDDYRMMGEVLERRFTSNDKAAIFPDLLVIDGGKGHLNVAVDVLGRMGLLDQVEPVSIAKDKFGKADKIYRPGRKNPLSLPRYSPVLFFLMQVRDESHRFGISFHRKLRRKTTLASELDKVPGIGPARKKILLRTIGSLAKIKNASREELAAVHGIGPELAEQIWDFFHSEAIIS
jgi:excinuclease ABC subunit C